MTDPIKLDRKLLEEGVLDELLAKEAPGVTLLTEKERTDALRAFLAIKPDGDVWLFGYGSLIWNPSIAYVESRIAAIDGWHRSFCLFTPAGRGTVEFPGLVLGLDCGGTCAGIAFRMDPQKLEDEFAMVWRREMLTGSYVPMWLPIHDSEGRQFGIAAAFTINHLGTSYAGGLERHAIIHRLATAAGFLGTAAEYLFQTCEALRSHGLADADLELLAAEVRLAIEKRP